MELSKCKIGIRPTIDGRWGGIREGLEEQTMGMAKAAKALIEANLTYSDGTPVQVVIADSTIGGGREAALCADKFGRENVCGTLSVTLVPSGTPLLFSKRITYCDKGPFEYVINKVLAEQYEYAIHLSGRA